MAEGLSQLRHWDLILCELGDPPVFIRCGDAASNVATCDCPVVRVVEVDGSLDRALDVLEGIVALADFGAQEPSPGWVRYQAPQVQAAREFLREHGRLGSVQREREER